MSGIPTEGPPDRPYRENPPTHFVEVHWTSGIAVKWQADTYVHAGGLTAAPNSPTGTLAFWIRFNVDLRTSREVTLISGDEYAYRLRVAPGDMTGHGSGDMYIDFAPGDDADDYRPVNFRFELAIVAQPFAYSIPGVPDSIVIDTYNFAGNAVSDGIVMTSPSAMAPGVGVWFHVYCEWNSQTGDCLLKINGRAVPSAAVTQDTTGDVSGGRFGFDVPWQKQPVDPRFPARGANQNTVFFWWDLTPDVVFAQPPYSIAEFWLEPGRVGIGVDKFVDVATGRPKNLGANGEAPLTGLPEMPGQPLRPAFYFGRRGAPRTFLENRGYAGAFTLAKTIEDFPAKVRVPIADVEKDGPLDEPDSPHFAPPAG